MVPGDTCSTNANTPNRRALANTTSDSTIDKRGGNNALANARDITTLVASKSRCSESDAKAATLFEIETANTVNDNSNANSNGTKGLPKVVHMMIRTLLIGRVFVQ
jgi:hypothetical protein